MTEPSSASFPFAVQPITRALGFAGLLPQAAAVVTVALGTAAGGWNGGLVASLAAVAALIYGAVILSFLGGIWWGFAMRRGNGQGGLAVLAVVPSLVAAGLVGAAAPLGLRWTLVLLGSAILLTLLVDRRLATAGEAPAGWMRLRVPLSLGLGGLTILAGILAPA
ncbi:DUF3429 domain-containing protein [Sphingomonas solaris]|uniref:DUF3429 domain-containing protein n=1 Tax=Alterirhizorhabdus solaris TaxID=2529389 RepID=A0A558RC36_9SPHN|nr:DUF3429 domain-containing protein [Sphingomonas solaris]TVV76822.1 DUF3429 domain-containing protein [Sphingomonas solaris]